MADATPPKRAGHAAASLSQVLRVDLAQLTLGEAARLLPGLVLVVAVGLFSGDREATAVATGGAFVVGFATFQPFARSRAVPMLVAALGMGLSSALGTLAGATTPTMVLAALAYAFVCGLLPAVGMGAFWVGQQCAVFLLIAGAYSGGLGSALARMTLVLAGASTEIGLYAVMLVLVEGTVRAPALAAVGLDARLAWSRLTAQVRARSPIFRFALHFSLALTAAVLVERLLAIPNGYWAAMTVVLLMRPDFQDTLQRSLARVGGTIAGALFAVLVRHALAPGPVAIAVLTMAFAFLAYATLRLNFGLFAFFLTGYVIFLLVGAGMAAPRAAGARILGTLVGGGIALTAHLDFYRAHRRRQLRRH